MFQRRIRVILYLNLFGNRDLQSRALAHWLPGDWSLITNLIS